MAGWRSASPPPGCHLISQIFSCNKQGRPGACLEQGVMQEMATNGKVFHVEVKSGDTAATSDFFKSAFGWPMMSPGGGFFMFDTPGNFEGHIGPLGEDPGASTVAYIEVDDVEAAEMTLSPISEAPGQGRFFYFKEPGGSVWVAWEHAKTGGQDG